MHVPRHAFAARRGLVVLHFADKNKAFIDFRAILLRIFLHYSTVEGTFAALCYYPRLYGLAADVMLA